MNGFFVRVPVPVNGKVVWRRPTCKRGPNVANWRVHLHVSGTGSVCLLKGLSVFVNGSRLPPRYIALPHSADSAVPPLGSEKSTRSEVFSLEDPS